LQTTEEFEPGRVNKLVEEQFRLFITNRHRGQSLLTAIVDEVKHLRT
jgi:hypothetical protein